MKKSEWNVGLNYIDSDVVEHYVEQKEILLKAKNKHIWVRIISTAACIALIFGIYIKSNHLYNPLYENAIFSAEEIASMFNGLNYLEYSTNAYTEKYVPDDKYLYVDELPKNNIFDLYKQNSSNIGINREEFQKFIDNILPKISNSIKTEFPQYEIKEGQNASDYDYLSSISKAGEYNIRFYQSISNSFTISNLYSNNGILLNNEIIQIDQIMSDDEIINSLQSVKIELFNIFGVSFQDSRVVRQFDAYHKAGATSISVYFYNQSEHPLSFAFASPRIDYVCIHFSNYKYSSDTVVSNDVIKASEIEFVERRVDISEFYTSFKSIEIIPLEEAEKLLYNGYVFGGHTCPRCMSMQDKISFKGYDFVDIEYVSGYDCNMGKAAVILPFYAFYKKIGISENGNSIYAKTYVAAIEVGGYKEYFKNQKENHKSKQ